MNIPEAIDAVLSEQFSDESNVRGSLHELEIVETIEQMKKAQILPQFIDAIAQKGSFGTTFGAGFILGIEVQKKLQEK